MIERGSSAGSDLSGVLGRTDFIAEAPFGIVSYNQDAQVVDCNDVAAAFFGYRRSELVGRSGATIGDFRLQHVDGSPLRAQEWPAARSLRERRPLRDVVIGIDAPAKELRWLRMSTSLVQSDDVVDGVVASWVDCTAEVELKHILDLGAAVVRMCEGSDDSGELLGRLCQLIVHDGRFPLAWIGTDVMDGQGGVEISYAAGQVDYLYEGIVSTRETDANGVGPTGTAFRTGEVQVAKNLATTLEYEFWRERVRDFGFWSAVAIPFRLTRHHVLTIYDRHLLGFDQAVIKGVEEMVEMVVQRAALLSARDELQGQLEGTIEALSRVIEVRDPFTEGHQTRVGQLAVGIARELGVDETTVALLRLAGEVHDIGKMAVPAEILTRPGRLSPLEFELVKGHCEVGADILRRAVLPWPIAEVAAQHHERLDGSGYPLGLVGEEIILPARIAAVADVVEAMSHHRPHRAALGIDAALAEIRAGAGTAFDGDVVTACERVFAAGFVWSYDS